LGAIGGRTLERSFNFGDDNMIEQAADGNHIYRGKIFGGVAGCGRSRSIKRQANRTKYERDNTLTDNTG
jgi:hypothetical protein